MALCADWEYETDIKDENGNAWWEFTYYLYQGLKLSNENKDYKFA